MGKEVLKGESTENDEEVTTDEICLIEVDC